MNLSRRSFVKAGVAGAAWMAARPELALARGLLTEPALDALVQRTLAAAKRAGATYADVRVVRRRAESVIDGVARHADSRAKFRHLRESVAALLAVSHARQSHRHPSCLR